MGSQPDTPHEPVWVLGQMGEGEDCSEVDCGRTDRRAPGGRWRLGSEYETVWVVGQHRAVAMRMGGREAGVLKARLRSLLHKPYAMGSQRYLCGKGTLWVQVSETS